MVLSIRISLKVSGYRVRRGRLDSRRSNDPQSFYIKTDLITLLKLIPSPRLFAEQVPARIKQFTDILLRGSVLFIGNGSEPVVVSRER